MSDATPDTITVTEQHYEDVRSVGADVPVEVSETSDDGKKGLFGEAGPNDFADLGPRAGVLARSAERMTRVR